MEKVNQEEIREFGRIINKLNDLTALVPLPRKDHADVEKEILFVMTIFSRLKQESVLAEKALNDLKLKTGSGIE